MSEPLFKLNRVPQRTYIMININAMVWYRDIGTAPAKRDNC